MFNTNKKNCFFAVQMQEWNTRALTNTLAEYKKYQAIKNDSIGKEFKYVIISGRRIGQSIRGRSSRAVLYRS